jgi:hypothetical protein
VWISAFSQSRLGNLVRSTWQNNQREKIASGLGKHVIKLTWQNTLANDIPYSSFGCALPSVQGPTAD